jgi:hypothetical protein
LIIALILGGFLYAVNTAVKAYRNQSSHFRDGEIAYHAARSAATSLERGLEELFAGPAPTGGRDRDFYHLVTRTRAPDLDGGEDTFTPPLLAALIPPEAEGRVNLTVRFLDVRPLGIPMPPGFPEDPYEKQGTMEIEAVAEVGSRIRRIRIRRPFTSFYRLPPLIGRFSLMLGELLGEQESINRMTYTPRLGLFQTYDNAEMA